MPLIPIILSWLTRLDPRRFVRNATRDRDAETRKRELRERLDRAEPKR